MGQRHSRSKSRELSVVIPTLNEAASIAASIKSARRGGRDIEVIVVDGGSRDQTCALARKHGAKVVCGRRGRGRQLNDGWRASAGQWCLFLHGDSRLPQGYRSLIDQELIKSKEAGSCTPVWGCFKTIKTEFHDSLQGKMLTSGVELRTRLLHMPYGDQALFVRRKTLEDFGGFREWPLLEDVELVDRLNKVSAPVIVPAGVETSGRRWSKLGFLQTSALNLVIIMSYRLGVDAPTLASWYYPARTTSTT